MSQSLIQSSLLAILLLTCSSCRAAADEPAILTDVKTFFEIQDVGRRVELVHRIESDPAYDRAKVGEYVNQARLFDDLESGRRQLDLPLSGGRTRKITLRIPKGYESSKAYPLLHVLHCGGCNADWSIRFAEQILGNRIDEYVVSAPYRHGEPDFHPCELAKVLRAIKELVHIDSGRVYVTGYSAGGCASWAFAVLHPDEFAALMPVAGSLFIGKQTSAFVPNLTHTYVLSVWGARDNERGWDSDSVGIAESNRRLRADVAQLGLPIDWHEYPNLGHGGVTLPRELLFPALERRRRELYPKHIRHTFQHPCQAKAYWLEQTSEGGKPASGRVAPIEQRPGEQLNRAIERALDEGRGELVGDIDGQTITVSVTNAEEVTLWIGDGMIDWSKPVRVLVDDHEVFNEALTPNLLVCLTQACRTRDFDRLRWAGLILQGKTPAKRIEPAK